MKRYVIAALVGLCLAAQVSWAQALESKAVTDSPAIRSEALKQARYLKSIYKTDDAIETLSQFVTPGRLDEEVISELAVIGIKLLEATSSPSVA